MRSVHTIILFGFVAQAHVEQLVPHDNVMSDAQELMHKLVGRALKASPPQHVDLDGMTLGKPSHLAIPLYPSLPFPTARLPPSLVMKGRLRPVDSVIVHNVIVHGLSEGDDNIDFKQKGVDHQTKSNPAEAAVAAEAEVESAAVEAGAGSKWNKLTPGVVEEVHSEEELDDCLLQSSGLVVLEVSAKSCWSCKTFAKNYKRVAEYFTKIRFLTVVGDENQSTLRLVRKRLNVTAVPSFYFFRAGDVMTNVDGANEDELRSTLSKCMLPEEIPEKPEKKSFFGFWGR